MIKLLRDNENESFNRWYSALVSTCATFAREGGEEHAQCDADSKNNLCKNSTVGSKQ